MVSTGALAVLLIVISLILGASISSTVLSTTWLKLLPIAAIIWFALNVISDFLSVAATRGLLRLVRNSHDGRRILLAIVMDTLILVVLASVPTGVAGSVAVDLAGNSDGAVHRVIWQDYLLGSVIGGNGEPQAIQSSVRWVVFLTFFTACFPSLFVWGTLFAAVVAIPGQGILYRGFAKLLVGFDDVRSIVVWGYSMIAIAIIGIGLLTIEESDAITPLQEDISLGIFSRNCDKGVSSTCLMLVAHYFDDVGEQKARQAREILDESCNLGDASSCHVAGVFYQVGPGGLEIDMTRARHLYEEACAGGSLLGCGNVAVFCEDGVGGTKDLPRARQLYEQLCEAGFPFGCTRLGLLYQYGRGIEKDVERARQLYQKACDLNENIDGAFGCATLADLYLKGKDVMKDVVQARKLYEKACSQGRASSCGTLGRFYRLGDGVEQNFSQAQHFYRDACDRRAGNGCNGLGYLYQFGHGVDISLEQARKFYEMGCNYKHMESCWRLGDLYRDEEGGERARELYDYACQQGDKTGCSRSLQLDSSPDE